MTPHPEQNTQRPSNLSDDKVVLFEVIKGAEGKCLVMNGTRIAGPKPWGGGSTVFTFKTTSKKIRELL